MNVAVWKSDSANSCDYPTLAPFHPSESYPEALSPDIGPEPNNIYRGVRELFRLYGLDTERFNTPEWNPLRKFIRPGDHVLLKPNLIKETHPRDPQGWMYMITHGSVIRAVADYVAIALQGRGEIIVADAPQTDSSFRAICDLLRLDEIRSHFVRRGTKFAIVDLRKYEWTARNDIVVSRRELEGDPSGYVLFDLGRDSLFYRHNGEGRYYGADYDRGQINEHHQGETHRYLLSGTAVKCDVFFNLPKLKTHKKCGVTMSLKNLVGINGDKNYLPHYTEGVPEKGGDQFPKSTPGHNVERAGLNSFRRIALAAPRMGPWVYYGAKKIASRFLGATAEVVRSGNWHGNDTTWRMCLDLNRLLIYGNADGSIRRLTDERKRYLTLIDGVIAGEGDGPIDVDRKAAGVMYFGEDPVCVDSAAAVTMGFDPQRLPILREAFAESALPLTDACLEDVTILSNNAAWRGRTLDMAPEETMKFRAHFGWRGAIELESKSRARRSPTVTIR